MASKLEILNRALALLAVEPIADLEEDSDQRRVLDAMYPDALGAALTRYRWTFARTRTAELAPLAGGATPDGFTRYAKPAGALVLVRLFDDNDREYHFRLDGAEIVPDEWPDMGGVSLFVSYVQSINEGLLPSYFVKALSHDLAAEACEPLTENSAKAERLMQMAEKLYLEAMRIDAQGEGNQSLIRDDELSMLTVR